jgi:D-inositol-3-phosphate glycosyltransferase
MAQQTQEDGDSLGKVLGSGSGHPLLGLVVPALEQGGGVPSVARFVRNTAVRAGRYRLKLISLAVSARDPLNLSLTRPRSWIQGVSVEQGEWGGLPFVRVGASFGELEIQRLRPRKALARELAACDLIQVVCGSPAWANTVIGLGKPVALQVATRARIERRRRDAKPQGLAGWWRKAMTEVTDRLDYSALRRVDAIQVENLWMLDYARRLNEHREIAIRYAPPGVDARRFMPSTEPRLAGRHDILCVGRLDDPRKNVNLLLEAFARLPDSLRATSRLLLAGSTGPTPDFWLRAQVLGLRDSVEFVLCPGQEELVRLHQRAAVFALPSDEEGFGVVILEAMACGVPVVTTRCGGPEGIITEGIDGFLVPRDDAGAMAMRLKTLLDSPELNEAMGRRARATIEARFTEEVAGQAFLEVWGRLLNRVDRR